MSYKKKNTQFAVLGLGRFGLSIVRTLSEYDVNILACDKDGGRLHDAVPYATQVVQADVSDEEALLELGLGNFDVVILAMGEDFEASIIATMLAKEAGAGSVIVKAKGLRQKKILESIGADRVVLPELEVGQKIAKKLVNPNILDILEDSERYMISEMSPLEEWIGRSLLDSDIRKKHNIMILAIQRNNKMLFPVSPDLILKEEDVLITLSEHKKSD